MANTMENLILPFGVDFTKATKSVSDFADMLMAVSKKAEAQKPIIWTSPTEFKVLQDTEKVIESTGKKIEENANKTAKGSVVLVENSNSFVQSMHNIKTSYEGVTSLIEIMQKTFGKYIEKAITAEKLAFRLDSVLKSSGTSINKKQVDELADSYSKLSNFTKGNIKEASIFYATQNNISKEVLPDLIKATMNYAVVMGKEMPDAAFIFSKALQEPAMKDGIKALTRAGIVLSQAEQSEIIKLQNQGKELEAQMFIVDKINKQFGDAWQFTDPVTKITKLKGAVEKGIGENLLKLVEPFLDTFAKMLDTINKVDPKLMSLVQTNVLLIGLWKTARPLLSTITSGMSLLKNATSATTEASVMQNAQTKISNALQLESNKVVIASGKAWKFLQANLGLFILGATVAYEIYSTYIKKVDKETKKTADNINDINSKKREFDALMSKLLDKNTTKDEKVSVIKQLNAEYKDYIGNLNLELISQKKTNELRDAGNALFEKEIKLMSRKNELLDLNTKINAAEDKKKQYESYNKDDLSASHTKDGPTWNGENNSKRISENDFKYNQTQIAEADKELKVLYERYKTLVGNIDDAMADLATGKKDLPTDKKLTKSDLDFADEKAYVDNWIKEHKEKTEYWNERLKELYDGYYLKQGKYKIKIASEDRNKFISEIKNILDSEKIDLRAEEAYVEKTRKTFEDQIRYWKERDKELDKGEYSEYGNKKDKKTIENYNNRLVLKGKIGDNIEKLSAQQADLKQLLEKTQAEAIKDDYSRELISAEAQYNKTIEELNEKYKGQWMLKEIIAAEDQNFRNRMDAIHTKYNEQLINSQKEVSKKALSLSKDEIFKEISDIKNRIQNEINAIDKDIKNYDVLFGENSDLRGKKLDKIDNLKKNNKKNEDEIVIKKDKLVNLSSSNDENKKVDDAYTENRKLKNWNSINEKEIGKAEYEINILQIKLKQVEENSEEYYNLRNKITGFQQTLIEKGKLINENNLKIATNDELLSSIPESNEIIKLNKEIDTLEYRIRENKKEIIADNNDLKNLGLSNNLLEEQKKLKTELLNLTKEEEKKLTIDFYEKFTGVSEEKQIQKLNDEERNIKKSVDSDIKLNETQKADFKLGFEKEYQKKRLEIANGSNRIELQSLKSGFNALANVANNALGNIWRNMFNDGKTLLDQFAISFLDTFTQLSTNAVITGLFSALIPGGGGFMVGFAKALGLAKGGTVTGGSGPDADDVPTFLSTGEEIIREKYASQNRGLLKALNAGISPLQYLGGSGLIGYQPQIEQRIRLDISPISLTGRGRDLKGVIDNHNRIDRSYYK